MIRALAALLCLALALLALPAQGQTRAWLDRSEIRYGETVALNIRTDRDVAAIDVAPLQAEFDIAGQTVRRSLSWAKGAGGRQTLFAFGLRPKAPGVLTIPPLRVGDTVTAPLRLVVKPPNTAAARADSDVFLETEVDDNRPYVQQSVGVTVRLYYGIALLSGELDQDPPSGATISQVGEDQRSRREIGGRLYNVLERRFLLIPERSGSLLLPGARFSGLRANDFFKDLLGARPNRDPVSAAAPLRRLEVRPIPAAAPQPWLPLRSLELRYLTRPRRVRTGEAVDVEIQMQADGATAAQLPPLQMEETPAAQVFAEPAQAQTDIIGGRPRARVQRRFSLVPSRPGRLSIPGPKVVWWDVAAGVARTAQLPALELDVVPGAAGVAPAGAPAPAQAQQTPGPQTESMPEPNWRLRWRALAVVVIALALAGGALGWSLWRRKRRRGGGAPVAGTSVPLPRALAEGDLDGIALALIDRAGPGAGALETVIARLGDANQRDAVARLQAALWGDGDRHGAVQALRRAFADGPRWQSAGVDAADPLPPLYPS